MLKEKITFKRTKGIMLVADFSAPTTTGYAMAWLKLTNNAREYSDMIWKIENERDTNNVYVICNPKSKEAVKEFLEEITYEYVKETDKYHSVGKVIEEHEIEVGVPVYEYESDCDLNDEQWEKDIDNSINYWVNVKEEF